MSDSPPHSYPLRDVLIDIGFVSDNERLQYDFGSCILYAGLTTNRYLKAGYQFYGNYFSQRSFGEFDFFILELVESHDQGLALISYYLRGYDFANTPSWLILGWTYKNHLPWRKSIVGYKNSPSAIIEYEWARVLISKILADIENALEDDITTFSFDGEKLKVSNNRQVHVIGCKGQQWKSDARIKTKDLVGLPKRLKKRGIVVVIWDGKLEIQNRLFNLV